LTKWSHRNQAAEGVMKMTARHKSSLIALTNRHHAEIIQKDEEMTTKLKRKMANVKRFTLKTVTVCTSWKTSSPFFKQP
jgi:ribosomal protein S17